MTPGPRVSSRDFRNGKGSPEAWVQRISCLAIAETILALLGRVCTAVVSQTERSQDRVDYLDKLLGESVDMYT